MIDKEQVIKGFFGLKNSAEQARVYGVTPARIRQIIYQRIDSDTRKKVMEARKKVNERKRKMAYREAYTKDPEFRKKMKQNALKRYYKLKTCNKN